MLQFVRKCFSTKAEKAGAWSCRRKHCLPEYSRQKTNMDHTKKWPQIWTILKKKKKSP